MYIGAYALGWAEHESRGWGLLAGTPEISGLELPWSGLIHANGERWLLDNLPDHWRLVVTSIPGTMAVLASDPGYGLAGDDPEAALGEMARLRDAVVSLNDTAGRSVVRAVELHGAPRAGSAAVLGASLARISEWDWDGASLLLEHVDASVTSHEPEKGFLTLEEELDALAGLPVGVLINWGRSAIELRDADRVVDHLREARDAGGLGGLMFSGVADSATAYGGPWADQHLPIALADAELGEPSSLLTPARMRAALEAAGSLDVLGLKVSWRGEGATLESGAAMVARSVELLSGLGSFYR